MCLCRAPLLALALAAVPAAADSAAGKAIWENNCEGCHGIGVAGAPVATSTDAWSPRIAQGTDTLYRNAIEGFYGPRGTMMPPRGGNDALTDQQVRDAVDYMIYLATQTIPGIAPTP